MVNFRKGKKLYQFPIQRDFGVPLPSFLGISKFRSSVTLGVDPGGSSQLPRVPRLVGFWEAGFDPEMSFSWLNTEGCTLVPVLPQECRNSLWASRITQGHFHKTQCAGVSEERAADSKGRLPTSSDRMRKLCLGPLTRLGRAEGSRSSQAV